MSDLPLPDGLIDAVNWVPGGILVQREQVQQILARALAFRDESGHRAVWSAGEVNELRHVLRRAIAAAEVHHKHRPAQYKGGGTFCSECGYEWPCPIEQGRAALDRVRGPGPAANDE